VSTSAPTSAGNVADSAELTAAIDEVFGDRAPIAYGYADFLVTAGIERGVIGPGEAARVWPRHILNSTALAGLIPANVRVVDLGSGAGLPGIPLAIARPDLAIVLLEPMQRRVRFLRDCLDLLQLPNVAIVAERAEAGVSPLADCVVVRAVAALDRLIPLAFGLLVDDGELLALKGSSAAAEVAALATGGGTVVIADLLTVPAFGEAATVVRVIRPAREGTSKRRPASRRSANRAKRAVRAAR
jgi:16S rRNA (guanine527-N7)-methyltransferase